MCMPFKKVRTFEKDIAKFYGAPYAVATDCCTHAIELCLRYKPPTETVTVPTHTYVSIPMTLEKLGIDWRFEHDEWEEYYYIKNTQVIDAAVYFSPSGYLEDTFMCLSFQYKKAINLGRGGAILCQTKEDHETLKAMAYDGRTCDDTPWAEQDIKHIGYHYYMTPEVAELGSEILPHATQSKDWTWEDYPDLSKMSVFKK